MMSVAPAQRRQGFAVASLVLGIVGLFTLGILGIGALLGIVFGVMALVKANNEPAEYGGKGKAIAGIALSLLSVLVMPFVIGIVAAIVIPSLLRARVSANEAAAIGEVRTVAAAEAAYQSANGGYFDTLSCLAGPSRCIPAHAGPSLLEPSASRLEPRHGYEPWFHAGPGAPSGGPRVSPSSLTAFAYGLVPVAPGRTGVRSFCTDATGRVCAYEAGRIDESDELKGSCPATCEDLR
jgi:Domain of unknown function (DUF4190)